MRKKLIATLVAACAVGALAAAPAGASTVTLEGSSGPLLVGDEVTLKSKNFAIYWGSGSPPIYCQLEFSAGEVLENGGSVASFEPLSQELAFDACAVTLGYQNVAAYVSNGEHGWEPIEIDAGGLSLELGFDVNVPALGLDCRFESAAEAEPSEWTPDELSLFGVFEVATTYDGWCPSEGVIEADLYLEDEEGNQVDIVIEP